MGLSIKVSGAAFSNFIDVQVPHLELAAGYWLFGGSEEDSRLNLAPNGTVPLATVVGQPIYGMGFATLTHENYFNTGVKIGTVNSDWTMIAIATENRSSYCGTWTANNDDAMLYTATDDNFKVAIRGSGASITPITADTGAAFRFMAGVKSGDNTGTGYLHNGAEMLSTTGEGGLATPAPADYLIGPASGFGISAPTHNHVANMLFPVALSAVQIQNIYDYFKAMLPKRGIELL